MADQIVTAPDEEYVVTFEQLRRIERELVALKGILDRGGRAFAGWGTWIDEIAPSGEAAEPFWDMLLLTADSCAEFADSSCPVSLEQLSGLVAVRRRLRSLTDAVEAADELISEVVWKVGRADELSNDAARDALMNHLENLARSRTDPPLPHGG
jgi:hypothetical protein